MTDKPADLPDSLRAPHDVRELYQFRAELQRQLTQARIFGNVSEQARLTEALAKLNEQAAKADDKAKR